MRKKHFKRNPQTFPCSLTNMGNKGTRLTNYLLNKEDIKEKNILQTRGLWDKGYSRKKQRYSIIQWQKISTEAGSFTIRGHMTTIPQLQQSVTNTDWQIKDIIYPRLLTEGCYRPTYNQGSSKVALSRGFYKPWKGENTEILSIPELRAADQENTGRREYFCVCCLVLSNPVTK